MAIFASTTTSGYSDPLKAQSIKALEQRLKDQQAQMAAQQPDAAMMATIPGGIGHVLGVVGDKMNQARSDQALVANRADLAKAMSGYDMNKGMTPEIRATLSRVAPEILDKLMTHEQERWKTTTTEAGATGRTNIQETAATGRTQMQEEAANKRNEATTGVTREGQKLDADVKREGYQVQIDLADKKNQAQREEAIADREFKGAQAELDRAQQTGTEAQKATAALRLSDAQNKLDMARDAANKAAELQNSREGRTATASESALERAHREQAQATDLAFKGGEGAAERASRKDLQVGQQQFTGTENAEERALKERLQQTAQAFQGGESAQERELREKLQGKSLEAAATEGAAGRAATAANQAAQIQATSDLADKQFGYSKESKAADQAFTKAEAELDRASKSGDRQAQIAAAKALAEAGQVHEKSMATDKMAHDERLAQHKIEAAQLAAKTTPDYIKATTEAKDTYANHLLSVEKLKEARALAPLIYTGPWQTMATGTVLATGGKIGDKASAEATTRFNSIMDEQAILAMSKTLKGQSTDFEMKEFKKVFNNPSASAQDRLAALDKLIAKADTDLTSHREALKSFTGSGDSATRIEAGMRPGGGGGGGAADPLQDAQNAINQGADFNAVAKRLQDAGLSASGLKQKGM